MNRYPEIHTTNIQSLILERENIVEILEQFFYKLTTLDPELLRIVEDLSSNPTEETLNSLVRHIFELIPMKTNETLHPLLSTGEQLENYLSGNTMNVGDCKLLTLITAYICIIKAKLKTVISIRNYSGHPVLFVDISHKPYKISYLHQDPEVKLFMGKDNPFVVSEELKVDPSFKDADFPNDKSILFWQIKDAIFVLDCMNILRRCVVNYVLDRDFYDRLFKKISDTLRNSGIYHNSVIFYWESELERVKDMLLDPRFEMDKDKFKEVISKSLRY